MLSWREFSIGKINHSSPNEQFANAPYQPYFQHISNIFNLSLKLFFLEILNHVSESPPTFFRYLTVTSPRFRPISLHHRQFGPASPLGWRLGDRNPAAGESSRRRDASRWPAPLCLSVANRCPEKTSSFGWENVGGWWRFFIGKNVMEWFQQGSHLSVDIITEDDPINQWTKGHLAGWRAKKRMIFSGLKPPAKINPVNSGKFHTVRLLSISV